MQMLAVSRSSSFLQKAVTRLAKGLLAQYLAISRARNYCKANRGKTHSSCAFDSAQQYFAKEQELFNALKLPDQKLSRDELFGWMKQHNPQLKMRI